LSQSALAGLADVAVITIKRAEAGGPITPTTLRKIIQALPMLAERLPPEWQIRGVEQHENA